VVHTLFRFIVVSSSITPRLLYVLAKDAPSCVFLQALLRKTNHNPPKTCKSHKQLILLQNFVGDTYKLKKGVGVPSSYINNCIRLGVVVLLSWPFASSKAATINNNSKGTLSTFESFKHPTSNNGK
jgi:hypothetical protein